MPTVEVVAPGEPLSSDRSVLSTIRGEAESPGDVLERQGSKLVKQHTMHYQMREVGKPWIGFAVRKAKNKDGILVRDVAKGGPAEAAGLQDGDQLVSIESMRIATMKMFKVAMTEFKRPGLVIEVGILRSGSPLTVKLEIGVKKQVDVGEVPPLTSSEEILDVLGDSVKLEQVAKAAFAAADADCSGLVTTKEFISAMREWLPAEISPYLGDNDLRKSFTNCDTDKSGYLGLVEFPRIMKGLLSSILEGERGLFGRRAASAKSLVMLGAPYAGWVVHKKRGVKRLYLVDIVEGGPADEAGLHENDELISVDGTRVGSYPKYRQLMKQCMVPGGKMTITYRRRGKKFSTELTVGTREPAIIQNVPQLHVMEDIGTVLNDEEKFSILAEHAFQSADADMSGLVTHQELLEALESWRPLAGLLSAEVLMEAVSLCDADESGYIAKREFPGFLRFLLNLVWRWHQLNSYPPMEVTVGKHPLPVQTHNIYQEWNTEGFLCGNFPAAPKKAWLRTTNQAQRPHFIVAVDSKVTLKKLNGLEQTVVLSPGDEVFIPQGTYYDYQSDDAESHFLFALGIGKASPMKLSFLESAAQSFRKGQIFHPWLGFQAEKDPTKKNQLLVREVPWGGPAAAAGMTDGDVLQSIDGTPVKSLKDFRKMVTECKLGDVVAVRVSRTEVSIGFEIEVKSSRLQNSLCAKKMTFASIKVLSPSPDQAFAVFRMHSLR